MGNCCLTFLIGENINTNRVLCHTCSIHPSSSSSDRNHGAWSTSNILGRPHRDISTEFELGDELGRGQFGVIRICKHRVSGLDLACKSIAKSKLTSSGDVRDVIREVEILNKLSGHPNIVQLRDVFEDSEFVHLVMELCQGGELFDRIVEHKMLSERESARICKNLVEVISFCHLNGVIHRDLKPENILLASKNDTNIKVADFGLAIHFRPGEKHSGMAGSAYYIAPEILRGEYGHEVDIWSAGVVLYVLLSGVPPFWDETEEGIFEAIRYGHLDLSSDPWPKRSPAVKNLLTGMLCQDPKARLTPADILNHEWIINNTSNVQDENGDVPSLPRLNIPRNNNSNADLRSWKSWQTSASVSSSSSSDSDTGFLEGLVAEDKQDSFTFISESSQRDAMEKEQNPSCSRKFDKWTSLTQVAEPTRKEFISMVISNLDNSGLPSPKLNTEVRLQEGWTCTVVKSNNSKRTVLVNSSQGKFLVVHDRENKRIGWKNQEYSQGCLDEYSKSPPWFNSDQLLWCSYPG